MARLPIERPYRAVVLGMMTLWTFLGIGVGIAALAGVRGAVSTNGRVRVGWEGLWAGIWTGVVLGVVLSGLAVASLWLGHLLQRWIARRQARSRSGTVPPAE